MIIASGFLEVLEVSEVERVSQSLAQYGVEVHGIKDDKIVYLLERESEEEIKRALAEMKEIEGVRNVYLTYFSTDFKENEEI